MIPVGSLKFPFVLVLFLSREEHLTESRIGDLCKVVELGLSYPRPVCNVISILRNKKDEESCMPKGFSRAIIYGSHLTFI